MVIDYKARRLSLKDEILKRRLDSLLVTTEANVSYLSGFGESDSLLLITKNKNFFLTDSRYIEEAQGSLKDFEVILIKSFTYKTLSELIIKNRIKTIFRMLHLAWNFFFETRDRFF